MSHTNYVSCRTPGRALASDRPVWLIGANKAPDNNCSRVQLAKVHSSVYLPVTLNPCLPFRTNNAGGRDVEIFVSSHVYARK